MDRGLIVGLVLGAALILMGIWTGGGALSAFVDLPAILIVLGGTLAATIVRFGVSGLSKCGQLLRIAAAGRTPDPEETIRHVVRLAEIARRDGLLAMEDENESLDDPFLRNGVQLVVDGTDPELVKSIMEIEMAFLEERHRSGQAMFSFMGSMSPAFGMLGTVIGLIIMLGRLNEPEAIGPGMALALITTFYGSVLANLVFLPIAGRLRRLTEEELLHKEIITEGILSIQQGENPRVIEHKLKAFLAPEQREVQVRSSARMARAETESVVS